MTPYYEIYRLPIFRVDTDVTYSITGFRPNATKMTAHHMLIYGKHDHKDNDTIAMILTVQVVRNQERKAQPGTAERWL